jgi:cytochrome b
MSARSDKSGIKPVAYGLETGSIQIWDPIVRLFHWTVVTGCAINLIFENGNRLHRAVGYGVAAAVAIRLIWGLVGHGHARFADFVPRPSTLIQYLRQLFARKEPRYIGHNPAGSIMIIALLGLLVAVSVTGWMMGLDRYFGDELLEELHEGSAMAILALAGIHVLAAVIESVRHRENLIKSMITGKKRRPTGTDVDHAIDTH